MRSFAVRVCAGFVALCVMVSASGCATWKTHPDFAERQKGIKRIAVIAPEMDAYLLTFKGDKKRLDDVAKIMQDASAEEVEKLFAEKGYEIKKVDLSKEKLMQDPDLKAAVFNINKIFNKTLGDIQLGKQKKFTYTVGSDINRFGDMSGADAVIFIKAEGVEKSSGEIAKDVMKGVAIAAAGALIGMVIVPAIQTQAIYMKVAVVDTTDGAVLWYHDNCADKNSVWSPRNPKHVKGLTRTLTKPFPEAFGKSIAKKTVAAEKSASTEAAPPAPVSGVAAPAAAVQVVK